MYGLGLKSLSVNFTATLGRQVGAGLLGLVTAAIIARVYGPEGNGAFAIALLLPGMLGTFLNFGIGSANIYFLGSSQVTVREAIRTNLRFFLWLMVIGLMVGVSVMIWKGEEFFPGVRPALLWLALPIFPIALLSAFLMSIFQGLQEFRMYNKLLIIKPILFLGALSLVTLSGNKRLELLIGVQLLTSFIVLVVTAVIIKRLYIASSEDGATTGDYSKRAIGYGWKAHLGNILAFVNYKADIFLVNFFMTPLSAGVYVVAVALAERLWLISSAVSTVLLPRLAQLSSDEESRKRLTPLISRLVLMVTLIGSIALALFSYPLILLMFGSQYMDSVLPVLILLPGIVILGGAKVWANDIAARGRPEINMYVSLVTLVANISGNLILIPQFGLAGAAVATTVSYWICSVITLIIYVRMTSNNWVETLFVNSADMRALMKVFAR
ncbi:MAG: flippase [Halothiobacillus sp.]|jgi:O-antigen/teichoic acid export membrane protein|nr:flippase [Halothiobacillus sp.]